MSEKLKCPVCAATRIIGVEVQGVYDGVLYWRCAECGTAFQRWGGDLGERAMPYIAADNAHRAGT